MKSWTQSKMSLASNMYILKAMDIRSDGDYQYHFINLLKHLQASEEFIRKANAVLARNCHDALHSIFAIYFGYILSKILHEEEPVLQTLNLVVSLTFRDFTLSLENYSVSYFDGVDTDYDNRYPDFVEMLWEKYSRSFCPDLLLNFVDALLHSSILMLLS